MQQEWSYRMVVLKSYQYYFHRLITTLSPISFYNQAGLEFGTPLPFSIQESCPHVFKSERSIFVKIWCKLVFLVTLVSTNEGIGQLSQVGLSLNKNFPCPLHQTDGLGLRTITQRKAQHNIKYCLKN